MFQRMGRQAQFIESILGWKTLCHAQLAFDEYPSRSDGKVGPND